MNYVMSALGVRELKPPRSQTIGRHHSYVRCGDGATELFVTELRLGTTHSFASRLTVTSDRVDAFSSAGYGLQNRRNVKSLPDMNELDRRERVSELVESSSQSVLMSM